MRHILSIVLLMLLSCGDNNPNCDVAVDYNMPFEIQVNDTYCHPDGSIFIIRNIDNSYCPCNANCVWEGEAYVEGEIIATDGSQSTLSIHEIQENQNTEGFKIVSVTTDKACDPEVQVISIMVLSR